MRFLILVIMLTFLANIGHAHISEEKHKHSWYKAKRDMYKISSGKLFYSGCSHNGKVVVNDCGYVSRKGNRRSRRVEVEHIVPASVILMKYECWWKGGRKLCYKDRTARAATCDLYNLQLVIGEINGDRSNRGFSALNGDTYGVGVKIDWDVDKISIPVSKRGDVARTYFYMRDMYDVVMTTEEEIQMQRWDTEDPVDASERERGEILYKLQGNRNPYIK